MAARTEPGTLIELASLPNLRDICGYPARGGRVQTGVLYPYFSDGLGIDSEGQQSLHAILVR